MKEVIIFCPQCGKQDSYLEKEPGDYNSPDIIIWEQEWQCSSCGYPQTRWNKFIEPKFKRITCLFKTIDQDGHLIREWSE